ncbi:MAG: multiheme c-type cytochrome [Myxococcota bacterium]
MRTTGARATFTIVALVLLPASGCEVAKDRNPDPTAPLARDTVLGPFLSAYWRLPVPFQGERPPGFTDVDASLEPETCRACHPTQYAQWRTSLHAEAFSPGFAGQLIEGDLAGPLPLRACQTCHAPLEEQQPVGPAGAGRPAHDAGLRGMGIVCAACHVRAHRRYGPPRRPDLPPLPEEVAHGGFEQRPEFHESRFCAERHQFFDDPGVNGKPIENTFAEWSASPQAAAGRSCQDCHMPDRQHLWRGIHDAEMVKQGVDSDLQLQPTEGDTVEAALLLRNRDVGHAFPTYVTPRVFLDVFQVDSGGREVPETRVSGVIARQVDLRSGVEIADTRVLPGETTQLLYRLPRAANATALVGRVTIDPDFHYRGVFATLLETYTDPAALRLIAEASERISTSTYVFAEIRRPLDAED